MQGSRNKFVKSWPINKKYWKTTRIPTPTSLLHIKLARPMYVKRTPSGNSSLKTRQIETLSETVQSHERNIAKIEKSIQSAKACHFCFSIQTILILESRQSNWKPALELLVQNIGSKFSAAFDRASSTSLRSVHRVILYSRYWMCWRNQNPRARRLRQMGHRYSCQVPRS